MIHVCIVFYEATLCGNSGDPRRVANVSKWAVDACRSRHISYDRHSSLALSEKASREVGLLHMIVSSMQRSFKHVQMMQANQ